VYIAVNYFKKNLTLSYYHPHKSLLLTTTGINSVSNGGVGDITTHINPCY